MNNTVIILAWRTTWYTEVTTEVGRAIASHNRRPPSTNCFNNRYRQPMVHVITIPGGFARACEIRRSKNRIESNPLKRVSPLRFRRNSRYVDYRKFPRFSRGNNDSCYKFRQYPILSSQAKLFYFYPDASYSLRVFIKEVVKGDVSRASICSWLACLFAKVSFSLKIKGRKKGRKEGRKEDFGLISRG